MQSFLFRIRLGARTGADERDFISDLISHLEENPSRHRARGASVAARVDLAPFAA